MSMVLSKRAQEFQDVLDCKNLALTVQELPGSTRKADAAAAALGCRKTQIIKSLVFRNAETDELLLFW